VILQSNLINLLVFRQIYLRFTEIEIVFIFSKTFEGFSKHEIGTKKHLKGFVWKTKKVVKLFIKAHFWM